MTGQGGENAVRARTGPPLGRHRRPVALILPWNGGRHQTRHGTAQKEGGRRRQEGGSKKERDTRGVSHSFVRAGGAGPAGGAQPTGMTPA